MSNEKDSMEALHEHIDVLREVSNIGSGNAATALANLLNRKVDIGIPIVDFLEFKSISEALGGSEKIFVAILVNLSRDINGMMMFLLNIPSANMLIESMLGTKRESEDFVFSEIELSVIEEIGNILSSSYLNSLGSLIDLSIQPSIPYICVDMAGAILSVPAIEVGKISDKALFIESQLFSGDEGDAGGYFILVPDRESFDVILRSLGVL